MTNRKDTDDITEAYLGIKASLTRYISRYFKRSHEAEDVVQEAYIKVFEAHRKREIQSPKAYLYQTARHIAATQLKKKSFALTDLIGDELPESDLLKTKTLEEQYESKENFEVFCRAVRSLPLKCRRAYVLCRVYQYSQKEVAQRMGISLKGVEGHLARATRRCIEFIDAERDGKHNTNTAENEHRNHEQR